MPCGPTCVCVGQPFECLAAAHPDEFPNLRAFCAGDVPHLRRHSLERSRLGYIEVAAAPPAAAMPRGLAFNDDDDHDEAPAPAGVADNPPARAFPGIARMAANLAAAVATNAVAAAVGVPAPSEDLVQARLAICRGTAETPPCESYRDDRCTRCGCALEAKASWRRQSCPAGKW